MARKTFDTIGELVDEIKNNKNTKQTPHKVVFDGVVKYTLAGNSDQALATVCRELGMHVERVPLGKLIINQEPLAQTG